MVCWDERWFYIEQTFTGRDGLAAVGWVKGILRDTHGSVEPQTVIEGVAPRRGQPAHAEDNRRMERADQGEAGKRLVLRPCEYVLSQVPKSGPGAPRST
jgi:hypothetical protein